MSGAVPSELSSLTNLSKHQCDVAGHSFTLLFTRLSFQSLDKLSLNINTLAGTISPDIGLLTNLCECRSTITSLLVSLRTSVLY